MKNISLIKLNGCKAEKQAVRNRLARKHYDVDRIIRENMQFLSRLSVSETSLPILDRNAKHGETLSFEEAFCGECYSLVATNRFLYNALRRSIAKALGGRFLREHALASGMSFAQLMAAKESLLCLAPEEIAGMASAGLMDLVVRFSLGEEITETSGMGGDIGFRLHGEVAKSINASTLSAIVLASLGVPAAKHGSYGNTSALGSTDAIERFGARINTETVAEVSRIWQHVGFVFFDAHWCKTMHDLSHLVRLETINHILGPMTPPIARMTRIHKVMGVNEKVHPEVIVRAYNILHERGFQTMGGIAVMTGLDGEGTRVNPEDKVAVRGYSVLDEVSPFATVVSTGYGGKFFGTDLLTPEDFGVCIVAEDILVRNISKVVLEANWTAIAGTHRPLANYLAMNSALALFTSRHLGHKDDAVQKGKINRKYLRECFKECHAAINSGKAKRKLVEYVRVTGGKLAISS